MKGGAGCGVAARWVFAAAVSLALMGGAEDMPTLNWMGRKEVVNAAKDVVMKILREDRELSHGEGDNILVHGDNLEALKALLPFFAGRVKCIYIDPPYNTGSAFEHYDDNLEHSTWLNLMYPRLELLRKFLREDGSIWISIDDREGAYLRVICDEIFGRQNFINSIHWQRAYSPKGDSKSIATQGEHILVYRKSEKWTLNKLPRTEEMNKIYKNPDNDVSPWRNSDAFGPSASTHQGMVYAIQHPFTGELIYPYANACWRYEQSEMLNIMSGWAVYELRDLDDAAKRAEICGVPVESVRKDVKAIMVKGALEDAKKSAAAVTSADDIPLRLGKERGYRLLKGSERTPAVCIKVPTGGGKTILAAG